MFIQFPALQSDGFEIISPATIDYNCIAWAADDNGRWWEPDRFGLKYWPPDVPRDYNIESFISAFETLGYVRCDDGDLETGHEKIGIYENLLGEFTHVAWQMEDGRWSSKLGDGNDIIHNSVNGLYGEFYGTVNVFMKRKRRRRVSK